MVSVWSVAGEARDDFVYPKLKEFRYNLAQEYDNVCGRDWGRRGRRLSALISVSRGKCGLKFEFVYRRSRQAGRGLMRQLLLLSLPVRPVCRAGCVQLRQSERGSPHITLHESFTMAKSLSLVCTYVCMYGLWHEAVVGLGLKTVCLVAIIYQERTFTCHV